MLPRMSKLSLGHPSSVPGASAGCSAPRCSIARACAGLLPVGTCGWAKAATLPMNANPVPLTKRFRNERELMLSMRCIAVIDRCRDGVLVCAMSLALVRARLQHVRVVHSAHVVG